MCFFSGFSVIIFKKFYFGGVKHLHHLPGYSPVGVALEMVLTARQSLQLTQEIELHTTNKM